MSTLDDHYFLEPDSWLWNRVLSPSIREREMLKGSETLAESLESWLMDRIHVSYADVITAKARALDVIESLTERTP